MTRTTPCTFYLQHMSCLATGEYACRTMVASTPKDYLEKPLSSQLSREEQQKSPSCTAIIQLRIVALQCVHVGEVVCGLHDQIISPVCDVTHVRKCSRPSPT